MMKFLTPLLPQPEDNQSAVEAMREKSPLLDPSSDPWLTHIEAMVEQMDFVEELQEKLQSMEDAYDAINPSVRTVFIPGSADHAFAEAVCEMRVALRILANCRQGLKKTYNDTTDALYSN